MLGIADTRLGERVVAAVVLEAGADATSDALRAHCRALLARYKVPDRVEIVKQMPKNAMSKVVKRELAPRVADVAES